MAEITLVIGAAAHCSDGFTGNVSYVVVDRSTRTVTHLVVEPKGREGLARLVPLDHVDAAAGKIRLRYTEAEFKNLSAAEETLAEIFRSGPEGWRPADDEPVVDGSEISPDREEIHTGEAGEVVWTREVDLVPLLVPTTENQIRGEHVHATDGNIGQLHALSIDPRTHQISHVHVLLKEGHLSRHREVAIPSDKVSGFAAGIHLNITKQQVWDLQPEPPGMPSEAEPEGMPSERAAAVNARGSKAQDPADVWVLPVRPRYLKAQCPDGIPVGKPFSLLVSIVLAAGSSNAELEPFGVLPGGGDVLLVVHAPRLRLLGDQRQTVHVPTEGDSSPVMFELRADAPGPHPVSITAWLGGNYLGELLVEIMAEPGRLPGPHQDVLAEITTEPTEGAVSLVVRYDKCQNTYHFEFRDEDNPGEVTSNLTYDPGPLVEQLVANLDELAKGRSGYSAAQAHNYLVNEGAKLWTKLVPAQLREQFWDRQHRIRQLTILADKDAVPWELLYPMDRGHDAGFLVEQFPVMRAIFQWLPSRTLNLRPARFVLPEGSLPEARDEIDAMRRLLDPGQPPSEVISALTPLQDLIASGNFGLLHFACHNLYNPDDGSSIRLDNVPFTPTLLSTAAINKVLARSAPTIFINACRSAGLAATYNQLDGWASEFLRAGAAAFIGSLWAVCDGTAREFAQELYRQLQAGSSLGIAVMRARQAAASQRDDPTWLAYTVYGNACATVSQRR